MIKYVSDEEITQKAEEFLELLRLNKERITKEQIEQGELYGVLVWFEGIQRDYVRSISILQKRLAVIREIQAVAEEIRGRLIDDK